MVSRELHLAVPDLGDTRQRALEITTEISAHRVQLQADALEALVALHVAYARARRAEQGSAARREERASVSHGRESGMKGHRCRGDRGVEGSRVARAPSIPRPLDPVARVSFPDLEPDPWPRPPAPSSTTVPPISPPPRPRRGC